MRRRLGFTLIELLIVMVIISIASTSIVVKSGHYYLMNKSADTVARELTALMQLARQQAVFSSSTLGLQLEGNRYHFLKLTNNHWEDLSKTDLFWREQVIPDNVMFNLQVEQPNAQQQNGIAPPIIFYSSGEVTPFHLIIERKDGNSRYTIEGTFAGSIHLE